VCTKHVPSLRLPQSQETCWLCKARRPEMSLLPNEDKVKEPSPKPRKVISPIKEVIENCIPVDPSIIYCAWKDCKNASRKNSKYCSRNCSNKNARLRYKSRKRDPRRLSGLSNTTD